MSDGPDLSWLDDGDNDPKPQKSSSGIASQAKLMYLISAALIVLSAILFVTIGGGTLVLWIQALPFLAGVYLGYRTWNASRG